MTRCDFSVRSEREERHIIGSSEPDVIIGSDKDQNRVQKEGQGSHGIPVRVVRSASGAVLRASADVRSEFENAVRDENHVLAMNENNSGGLVHVWVGCM